MELANTFIRLLAVSQVMLIIGILFISKNPLQVRAIGITLMTAAVTYLLAPLILQYSDIVNIKMINAVPSLIPVLTLLFVWVVFEEDKPIPSWLIAMFVVDCILSVWRVSHGYSVLEGEIIAKPIKIFAACYAIYLVWCGREDDLVENRLKMRIVFIGALAIIVLGGTIAESLRIKGIEVPHIMGSICIFIYAFFGNLSFIKLNPDLNLVGDPKETVTSEQTSDPIIDNIRQRMRDERLYADHDLRVASLAELVGLPAHQLRQKINQNLGYRNFNQFVNRYRIEEAGQRLIEDNRTPVLSIALDVGFRSISSFNTAFQSQFGVSPTKYRSQAGF